MSFWQEKDEQKLDAPVADFIFHVQCRSLPSDHADELRSALHETLPWLADEKGVAIIPVLGAASGNGWMRPTGEDSVIHTSRRSFFCLRLPKQREADVKQLEGRTLQIGDEPVAVTRTKVRPLLAHSTLLARHIALPEVEDEDTFLQAVAGGLSHLGIRPSKIMSGQCARIRVADEYMPVRGAMVAELTPSESLHLQTVGMGDRLTWGCGVFLPHKGIAPVGQAKEEYAAT